MQLTQNNPDRQLKRCLTLLIVTALAPIFAATGKAQVNILPYRPVASLYSSSLDEIVMITSNANQLHIYNPLTQADAAVNLPQSPISLAISPDGNSAMVGMSGQISYVNLVAGQLIYTANVSITVENLILGISYAWLFGAPETTNYMGPLVISAATGAVLSSINYTEYYLTRGVLNQAGTAIYAVEDGTTPQNLYETDVTSGGMADLSQWPYNGEYSACGPVWLSPDGTRVYTGCATIAHASSDSALDMYYLRTLPVTTGSITSLAESASAGRVAVIAGPPPPPAGTATPDYEVQLFTNDYFNPAGTLQLSPFVTATASFTAHGKAVFYNSASTNLYVVEEADSSSNLLYDYAVETFTLANPPICEPTFGTETASVNSSGSLGSTAISAGAECQYNAVSNATWIQIISGGYGSGNGTLTWIARPNLSAAARNGTLSLGSQIFAIYQAGAPALPPALSALSYNITDAGYSTWLDRLITVTAAPNELHIYDPVGQGDQIIPLPLPPLAVSVSLDGKFAAVGHDGWITYVNLQTAAIIETVPIVTDVHHVLLGGNGYIYAFPQASYANIFSLNVSSGIATAAVANYEGRIPRLEPNGNYFYLGDEVGTSKWNITQGIAQGFEDWPASTGDTISCADYWLSQDGTLFFSGCGKVYFTSDTPSQDLQPAGSITGLSSLQWVANSAIAQTTAVIPAAATSAPNDTEIQLFATGSALTYSATQPIPLFNVSGTNYPAHGTFAFWNSDSSRLFTIVTADPTANLQSNNAIFTSAFSPAPAPAVSSLSPNPMPGSSSPQILNINGSGFINGAGLQVQLVSGTGATMTFTGSQIAFVSPSRLEVSITTGTAPSTWTLTVTNPDGESSVAVSLTVTTPPPVISSLSPNPIVASGTPQTLTINGTGFQNGAGLEVQTPAGGPTTTLQSSQITWVSSSELQVSITTGTAAATWAVAVINPNGQSSAGANLAIILPPPVAFVTGYALSGQALRNDFSGWVGMKITVGSNPITVTGLGRICAANNAQVHTVELVSAATGSNAPVTSASVNMAGCAAGQFVFASITQVVLSAGTSYYLASLETQGGDLWYDQGAISTTNVATATNSVYYYGGNWININSVNTSYVPPSFQYLTAATTQYLLTTSVSPAGGGTIGASPSASGGLYTSGTPVQLTATPAAGCSFTGWSGALTGTTNPQTVTMSSAQTVTANFQCSAAPPAGTAFVTGYGLSGQTLRNDFTGWVGMKLTAGANPIAVSALGRICVANNSQTHTVQFVNASNGTAIAGASASVNMAGCTPGQFVFSSIGPITLTAGASYYLVSQEMQGGDQWYDQGTISATAVAAVNNSVYYYGGNWIPINTTNTSYVPPSFEYTTGGVTQYLLTTGVSPAGSGTIATSPSAAGGLYASGTPVQLTATPSAGCTFVDWTGALTGSANPQTVTMSAAATVTANFECSEAPPAGTAFVTGYDLSGQSPRDDFTGWVGMKLTVGASALNVSALGRICVTGNAQTHSVKFVYASTGSDVPGASSSVNMAGCTVGQFVYSPIGAITLQPGTSYYLVSQEAQGGDLWYDQGGIATTAAATVNSSVYSWNGSWVSGSANASYVPPGFLYSN